MAITKKHPPPKTRDEVLALMKLTKSQGTAAYASKMASLLSFLNDTSALLTGAEIIEDDLILDDSGQRLPMKKIREMYLDKKISSFECNNPDIQTLKREVQECNSKMDDHHTIIRRKNKEEKKEKSSAALADLEKSVSVLRAKITEAIETEKMKLQATEFRLEEMMQCLSLLHGVKIKVVLTTGLYSFAVPKTGSFYSFVCDMLGLSHDTPKAEKIHIKRMFTMPKEVLDSFKKAIPFIGTDDLRSVMTTVLLEINENKMVVVATDAHRLFKSREFDVQGPPGSFSYKLPRKSFERLPKSIKEDFTFYELKDNKAMFLDRTFDLFEGRYPAWKAVIPEYEKSILLDRAELVRLTKRMIPYANKSTSQVNYHFNGLIELAAQEVDFSYECQCRMNYIKKDMEDLLIAFNGKMLVEVLNTFKEDEITFKASTPTSGAIFTDGNDTALIMPLMI